MFIERMKCVNCIVTYLHCDLIMSMKEISDILMVGIPNEFQN